MAYRAGRYFEELCVQQDSEDEIAQSVFFLQSMIWIFMDKNSHQNFSILIYIKL